MDNTWPAYAVFRRGHLLYEQFFYDYDSAYLYKLASYAHVADEDVPCEEWMKIEGITIEKVMIVRN